MSEALSIAPFAREHVSTIRFARWDTGCSSEAEEIRERAAEVDSNFEQSEALFGEKSAAISQLHELAKECSYLNWDGEGSLPLNPQAVSITENLIRALPEGVALPEFAPEPDGSVSLDWIRSRKRLLSMSIGVRNRLAYAWRNGTDTGYAVDYFDERTIPSGVLSRINAVVSDGNASVGAS